MTGLSESATQRRKNDFEAWFEKERRAAWSSFYKAWPELAESDPSPEFGMGNKEGFWTVWNAALDSALVELPDVRSATDIAYFNADVIDAIERAGLRVK